METLEIEGLIGLLVSFIIMLTIAGWFYYSFYLQYEGKERKKHL